MVITNTDDLGRCFFSTGRIQIPYVGQNTIGNPPSEPVASSEPTAGLVAL